ncbi:hypothetical protein M0804_003907 [Polistes exclamans]|nr:hypothetical protein M0804_003907 [Polistes exclamans]
MAMDRTMYGKVQPGATYQPFRITMKKGSPPGCKTSLLYYMSAMGLSLGPNAHSFVSKEDAERISISDARAQGSTREGRMARRQQQLNILEANDEAEGSSYGAGIDDTIVGGQNFSETAKPIDNLDQRYLGHRQALFFGGLSADHLQELGDPIFF